MTIFPHHEQDADIAGIVGNPTVYLNGEFIPLSKAKISVLDRGFIFGDGVYEVVPVYGRKPFRMAQHLARLARSLAALRIDNPFTIEQWQHLLQQLIDTSDQADQFLYIQLTRGVAKRDHAFVTGIRPTIFAMTSNFVRPTQEQRTQGLKAVSMPDERWLHCEIKSISLLGNVMARQFAVDQSAAEVLQFRDGYLTEGSASNIWVVLNGTVLAPPNNHLILEGIRYGFIQQLCQENGIPFVSRQITQAEVLSAQEIMLTSATKEILPIVSLDKQSVGQGVPGPVYLRLRQAYDREIENH